MDLNNELCKRKHCVFMLNVEHIWKTLPWMHCSLLHSQHWENASTSLGCRKLKLTGIFLTSGWWGGSNVSGAASGMVVLSYEKEDWTSHGKQASKPHPSIASPSAPASRSPPSLSSSLGCPQCTVIWNFTVN